MSKSPTENWPAWSPKDLKAAYATLSKVAPSKWVPLDNLDYAMKQFEGLQPAEYLLGVGKQAECLRIIELLATDLRMKNVWVRLDEAVARVRSGKVVTFLTSREKESVYCEVARACVRSMHSAKTKAPVTRHGWKVRHTSIAAAARNLAVLLRRDGFIDPELGSILATFSEKTFHDLAGEVYFHLGPHIYEERDVAELENERKQTQEEIDADEAKWEEGVKQLQYWLRQAMERGAPRLETMLLQLAESAEAAARNPPFVGPTARASREVFILNGSLYTYFCRYAFLKPLDDIVAIISEVVTGRQVSAESVKTRRHRWMKHALKHPR